MKFVFTTVVNVPEYVIKQLLAEGYRQRKDCFQKFVRGDGFNIKQVATFTQDKRIRVAYFYKQGPRYIEYDCEYFEFNEFV